MVDDLNAVDLGFVDIHLDAVLPLEVMARWLAANVGSTAREDASIFTDNVPLAGKKRRRDELISIAFDGHSLRLDSWTQISDQGRIWSDRIRPVASDDDEPVDHGRVF
jgi:hypothetical protein